MPGNNHNPVSPKPKHAALFYHEVGEAFRRISKTDAKLGDMSLETIAGQVLGDRARGEKTLKPNWSQSSIFSAEREDSKDDGPGESGPAAAPGCSAATPDAVDPTTSGAAVPPGEVEPADS